VLGGDDFFTSLPYSRKPVLEDVHVAGRPALTLNPAISFLPTCRDSFSDARFIIAK
jgi:hypothetical protein